jgi:phospholipase/carboxylesterase
VAGIVGISGWVYEPEQLLKEIPPDGPRRRVLMTHGTVDPMVPFSSVKQQVQLLTKAGLNIEWQEFQKAHTIAGEHELDVIRGFVERCYAAPYAP